MKIISPSWLNNLPKRPVDSLTPAAANLQLHRLGLPLARWIAAPALLERAARFWQAYDLNAGKPQPNAEASKFSAACRDVNEQETKADNLLLSVPPKLPQQSGCCWVVFVIPNNPYTVLREAFVLPFAWKPGTAHSPLLPHSVCNVADQVLNTLRQEASHEAQYQQDWGLHFAPGLQLEGYDLSPLWNVSCESGFASLAAGLIVAAEGGTPRSEVWASASWDMEGGLAPVDGLSAKLQLAVQWGARRFFVVASQFEGANRYAGDEQLPLTIEKLSADKGVRWALTPYLDLLEAPPLPSAPRPQRLAHYQRLQASSKTGAARKYYHDCMVGDLAACARKQLADPPEHPILVTVLSGSPELVSLVSSMLEASRCLVFHTLDLKDHESLLQELADWLRARLGIKSEPIPLCTGDPFDEIQQALALRRPSFQGRPLVIDLTPGRKTHTLALREAALPGDLLLYVESEVVDRNPVPWTESPRLWQATTLSVGAAIAGTQQSS